MEQWEIDLRADLEPQSIGGVWVSLDCGGYCWLTPQEWINLEVEKERYVREIIIEAKSEIPPKDGWEEQVASAATSPATEANDDFYVLLEGRLSLCWTKQS